MDYPKFKLHIGKSCIDEDPIELFFETYMEMSFLVQLIRKGEYKLKKSAAWTTQFIKKNEDWDWKEINEAEKDWYIYTTQL